MEMATPIVSATSSVVAPRRARLRPWAAMHPSHSRVMEMAERDELLGLDRQRAVGEGRVVERVVAGHDVGDGLAQRPVGLPEVVLNLMKVSVCHGKC